MQIGQYKKIKTDRKCPECNKPIIAFERTLASDDGNFDMLDGYFECPCGFSRESFA